MCRVQGERKTDLDVDVDGEYDTDGEPSIGPVTDYSATMIHWMGRYRTPKHRPLRGERERPSPSYIVDVS